MKTERENENKKDGTCPICGTPFWGRTCSTNGQVRSGWRLEIGWEGCWAFDLKLIGQWHKSSRIRDSTSNSGHACAEEEGWGGGALERRGLPSAQGCEKKEFDCQWLLQLNSSIHKLNRAPSITKCSERQSQRGQAKASEWHWPQREKGGCWQSQHIHVEGRQWGESVSVSLSQWGKEELGKSSSGAITARGGATHEIGRSRWCGVGRVRKGRARANNLWKGEAHVLGLGLGWVYRIMHFFFFDLIWTSPSWGSGPGCTWWGTMGHKDPKRTAWFRHSGWPPSIGCILGWWHSPN